MRSTGRVTGAVSFAPEFPHDISATLSGMCFAIGCYLVSALKTQLQLTHRYEDTRLTLYALHGATKPLSRIRFYVYDGSASVRYRCQ